MNFWAVSHWGDEAISCFVVVLPCKLEVCERCKMTHANWHCCCKLSCNNLFFGSFHLIFSSCERRKERKRKRSGVSKFHHDAAIRQICWLIQTDKCEDDSTLHDPYTQSSVVVPNLGVGALTRGHEMNLTGYENNIDLFLKVCFINPCSFFGLFFNICFLYIVLTHQASKIFKWNNVRI